MLKRGIFLFVIIVSLIGVVSATTVCSPGSITKTFSKGDTISNTAISCQNQNPQDSVTINKVGSFFSTLEQTPFIISPNGTKNFEIVFDENYQTGTHEGALTFSDGTTPLMVKAIIDEPPQSESGIIVFPTNQITTVQQGNKKNQNILISVPNNYPRVVTIQSVNFNPVVETIKFGDISLGQISPGQNAQIPIIYSGEDAQVGTYQTILNILATDSEGQINLPNVNLQLEVTSGILPGQGENSTKPSCSLSSNSLNLNESYDLTCSGVTNSVTINIPHNEFIEGTGVEVSGNIYKYTFKPIKSGVTSFIAEFKRLGASIFAPFISEVSIGSGGKGTAMELDFSPSLNDAGPGDEVRISIVDNKTDSIITNARLLIDGVEIQRAGFSFPFSFDEGKTYNFRAIDLDGTYSDLIKEVSLDSGIEIFVSPDSGDTLTSFSINTSINASLFINGDKINNPYTGTLRGGLNEIRAIAQGEVDGFRNITIEENLRININGVFEKNTNQLWTLNKNASWELVHRDEDGIESVISEGEGDKVQEFIPKEKGFYYIKSEGKIIGSEWELSGRSLKSFWWIPAILVLGGLLFMYQRNKDDSYSGGDEPSWTTGVSQPSPFEGEVDTGEY